MKLTGKLLTFIFCSLSSVQLQAQGVNTCHAATPPATAKNRFTVAHHLTYARLKKGDIATACIKDLAVQGRHGAEFIKYWNMKITARIASCAQQDPAPQAVQCTEQHTFFYPPRVLRSIKEGQRIHSRADVTSMPENAGQNLLLLHNKTTWLYRIHMALNLLTSG